MQNFIIATIPDFSVEAGHTRPAVFIETGRPTRGGTQTWHGSSDPCAEESPERLHFRDLMSLCGLSILSKKSL